MSHSDGSHNANRRFLWAICLIVLVYVVLAIFGVPQNAGGHPVHLAELAAASGHAGEHPPYWTVLPFVILLLAVAVLPLLPWTAHWWESNLHRFYVAAALAGATMLYYLFWRAFPLAAHWPTPHLAMPSGGGPNLAIARDVVAKAIFGEYLPFILLLLSLYTIGGAIRIDVAIPATPGTNAIILAIGGVLASFVGTTGAAMLLIRPLLESNRQRKHVAHSVVFFIFIVCNCGGCLLPTGDPPLFLGYLLKVNFLWTLTLWPEWAFVNISLLAIYFLLDSLWYYRREPAEAVARDQTRVHRLRFAGLWPNAFLLAATIISVALFDPGKPFPGTAWHPWLLLREVVLLSLIAFSLLGHHGLRQANQFNYHAIVEVAVLFFGIFICMQPALEMLEIQGPRLGLQTPWQFFWCTGGLSAVLDNAPTYVVFFETAKSLGGGTVATAGVAPTLLAAISFGAVFMGAMTYIGNGPNFMVRAIAQQSGVRMPGFFGYMIYSGLILLPLLLAAELLFIR